MSLPPRTGAIRVANCGLPEPHRIANSPLSSGPADFPASPSKRCSAIVQWLSGRWYGLFHRPALKTADERGPHVIGANREHNCRKNEDRSGDGERIRQLQAGAKLTQPLPWHFHQIGDPHRKVRDQLLLYRRQRLAGLRGEGSTAELRNLIPVQRERSLQKNSSRSPVRPRDLCSQ